MKTLVIVTLSLSLVAYSNLSTNNYNSESLEHVRQHDMSKSGDNHRDRDFQVVMLKIALVVVILVVIFNISNDKKRELFSSLSSSI